MFQKWELLVLSKLKWDMAAVTPHDFLKHLLNRITIEDEWNISYDMVLNHAKTLITLCARGKWYSIFYLNFCSFTSFTTIVIYWVAKKVKPLLIKFTLLSCTFFLLFFLECVRFVQWRLLAFRDRFSSTRAITHQWYTEH